MIATITQTTTPSATPDLKAARAPTPTPSPHCPSPTAHCLPQHVSEPELLTDFLAAEAPLLALCELHDIQLDDLLRWLDHPRTRAPLAAPEQAASISASQSRRF